MVTLGPLTNVALALAKETSDCVASEPLRGDGRQSVCEGNVTPAAEYNVWSIRRRRSWLMLSGLPIELVGWHLCRGDAVLARR